MIYDKQKQFSLEEIDYMSKLDLQNWIRFFFILKEVEKKRLKSVLEIGPGEGTLKKLFAPYAERYDTIDVNSKLSPTYVSDVRKRIENINETYDCVIAADILEHIPFTDLSNALPNIYSYLKKDGVALITIPHRASHFLFMSPTNIPHFIRIPTGFLSFGSFYRRFIKRKIWIDPDHEWEIGDGHHTINDVAEVMKSAGFTIEKIDKLIYVDFFVLKK